MMLNDLQVGKTYKHNRKGLNFNFYILRIIEGSGINCIAYGHDNTGTWRNAIFYNADTWGHATPISLEKFREEYSGYDPLPSLGEIKIPLIF